MFQAGSTEPYRTQGLDLIGESGNIVRRTFVEEENGKEIYKIVSELKYKKVGDIDTIEENAVGVSLDPKFNIGGSSRWRAKILWVKQ